MPVSGHEMKQILTLTGLASIPSSAVVLDEDFPQQTLQTAIILAKDLQTDLVELMNASCSAESKDNTEKSEQIARDSKSTHIPSEDYAKVRRCNFHFTLVFLCLTGFHVAGNHVRFTIRMYCKMDRYVLCSSNHRK